MYTQASLAPTQLAPDTLDQGYMECSNLLRELIDMEQGGQLVVDEVAYMVADMEVDEVANTWWPTWRWTKWPTYHAPIRWESWIGLKLFDFDFGASSKLCNFIYLLSKGTFDVLRSVSAL